MPRMGMYASGRTFGKERAGDLRAKINEQVSEVSKRSGVSMEQALRDKERDERRDRFFAKLSRKTTNVQEVLRIDWTDKPELKTLPVFVTREMFHFIARFVEFAPVEATKKQVDEIFDSLDDKFGKHPERLVTKELLKTARSSALAKMVKRTTRDEIVVNRLMYEWEERWREKNDKHVERHARDVVYMKAAEDRARREFINVLHNTELRKIRQSHARTRQLSQALNMPHAFDASRGERPVWGVLGSQSKMRTSSPSMGLGNRKGGGLPASDRVMDLRDEHDYGGDEIFVPRMTDMTLKPPSRHAHDRLAVSLSASLSAPVLPSAMLPSSPTVGGRVRTPSHAQPDPRVATPGWELEFNAVQRLSTPKVPKHRLLPTAHSDVSWSAQRVASGDLKLTMGRSRRSRGHFAGSSSAAQLGSAPQSLPFIASGSVRHGVSPHDGEDVGGAPGERAAVS